MANRYWVGGASTNWGTFGNWATTSGGAATAAVPTSSDDVFFDGNSGSGTVYVNSGSFVSVNANNVNFTGYTGTFNMGANNNTLNVYGSLTNGAGMTWTDTGSGSYIYFRGAANTITPNGVSMASIAISIASGASYTLAGAITVLYMDIAGSLTTANYNLTCAGNQSSYISASLILNAGTLTLGSSTVTLGYLRVASTGTTLNAGTSTVAFPASPAMQPEINISGKTLYNVTAVVQNDGYASRGFTVTGGFTCTNLTFSGAAASPNGQRLTIGGDITVTGALTLNGNSVKTRMFVRSNQIGTTRTITANTCTASYVDFASITIAGAAAPISGTSLGDATRNSGITFTAPKTVYFSSVASYAGWSDSNVWATSSGGAGSDSNFPLPQDTVIFDDNSLAASGTFTIGGAFAYQEIQLGALTFAARTTAVVIQCTSTPYAVSNVTFCTNASGTFSITFGNSSAVTLTPFSVQANSLYVECTGTTAALGGNLSVRSDVTFYSGTFSVGTYTVTFLPTYNAKITVSYAAYGVSTLNTGTGVMDMQGSGTVFDAAGSSLFSVTGTGTIKFSSNSSKAISVIAGIPFSATIDQAGSGLLDITVGSTYGNITNSYGATGATTVRLTAYNSSSNPTPYVFTSFNLSGTSGKNCAFTSTGGRALLQRSSGTWYMGANSTDAGNNSGLVFAAGGGVDYLTVSNINGTTAQNGFLIFC